MHSRALDLTILIGRCALQADVEAFNKANRWKKRGVGVTAAKYGIAHAYIKAAASIKIFDSDGTILVNHSGCEIGQGLNTK